MSSKIDIQAQDAVPIEAVPVEGGTQVKARGYWELVWIRFRRDKLALVSIAFVVFLLFASFIGGPIMTHVLGHGPNTIFANGVDQHSLAPVGPWTHISNADYLGETQAVFASAHPGQHLGTALLPLGADGSLGRDLFLRLLYGAQTSLEVAVLATVGSVALGVLMGLLAGYFRGWVDTVVSRLIEVVMVFPALLFIIAVRVVAGPQLNSITFGFLARGVFTFSPDLLGDRLVLPSQDHPRRRLLPPREGVRRGGEDDGRERLPDHAVAPVAAPRRADRRLLDADHRLEHPRRGRPLVPRPRYRATDRELGKPARSCTRLLPHPAVADGLAGPRRSSSRRSPSTCSATACGTRSTPAPASSGTCQGAFTRC